MHGPSREQRARFVLRPGFLDAERAKDLGRIIPNDNPVQTRDFLQRGIDEGRFEVLEILEGTKPVGISIFEILEKPGGKECLSVATIADGESDVTRLAMPLLEQVAKDRGCKSIRLHTMRTGLVRKLVEQDWFVSEILMRKELNA